MCSLKYIAVISVVALSGPAIADSIYGFKPGPTYRTLTPEEAWKFALDNQRVHEENEATKLKFALIGLVVLFGGIFLLRWLSANRRNIANRTEDIFVGSLAGAVKAKRSLSSKIEERIKSGDSK